MADKRATSGDFNPEEVSSNEVYKFLVSHWQHQNQLSWSRLNVMLLLELAILGGGYAVRSDPLMSVAIVLAGTLVGLILYRLVRRDWEIRDRHHELLDRVHKPLGISMTAEPATNSDTGGAILRQLFAVLVLANVVALGFFVLSAPTAEKAARASSAAAAPSR